jgi:hypothetical protein
MAHPLPGGHRCRSTSRRSVMRCRVSRRGAHAAGQTRSPGPLGRRTTSAGAALLPRHSPVRAPRLTTVTNAVTLGRPPCRRDLLTPGRWGAWALLA